MDENYEADFDFDGDNGLLPQDVSNAATRKKDKVKAEDDDEEEEDSDGKGKAIVRASKKPTQGDDDSEDGDSKEDGVSDSDTDEEEEDDEEDNQHTWVQHMLVLADHRSKVERAAATWLAEQGIKLRAQRKGKKIVRYPRVFEEGKDDSHDIDFGEKRICGVLTQDIQSRGMDQAMGLGGAQRQQGQEQDDDDDDDDDDED